MDFEGKYTKLANLFKKLMKVTVNVRKTTKQEKKEFFIGFGVLVISILLIKNFF